MLHSALFDLHSLSFKLELHLDQQAAYQNRDVTGWLFRETELKAAAKTRFYCCKGLVN